MNINLQHISKHFGDELLFDDVSLTFTSPSSTALLGINGSGKSTLLQIIATYMMPSKGKVIFEQNGKIIDPENIYSHVSFCAPYLELIEEMNLNEFLQYHFTFKKAVCSNDEIISLIGLQHAKDKPIEKFSSGMKQRVKLAQAIFADTQVLCLDEPCTNLDEQGIALYQQLIENYCRNRILIVASNDKVEYGVCEQIFQVSK